MSAWQWQCVYGERPVQDTLAGAGLRTTSSDAFPISGSCPPNTGAEWVPRFVRKLDKSRGMGRNGPWVGGPLRERPSKAIFRRHVRVVPYPEEPERNESHRGESRVDRVARDRNPIFPAPRAWPNHVDFLGLLEGLPAEEQRRIMRTTRWTSSRAGPAPEASAR